MSDRGLKKAVIIGAVLGALVTLGTALSMDLVLSDTLQGTWRDAAAKDVTRMFGTSCGQNFGRSRSSWCSSWSFLAAFGAVLGVVAGVIMNRFFKLVLK